MPNAKNSGAHVTATDTANRSVSAKQKAFFLPNLKKGTHFTKLYTFLSSIYIVLPIIEEHYTTW